MILPVVPSALHNYLAEGELVPLTSTAGINLYTGNRPGADGFSAIPVHSRWEAAMEIRVGRGTGNDRDARSILARRDLPDGSGATPGR